MDTSPDKPKKLKTGIRRGLRGDSGVSSISCRISRTPGSERIWRVLTHSPILAGGHFRVSFANALCGSGWRGSLNIETKITGTVSLDADMKGINMSRIIRLFYEYKNRMYFLPKSWARFSVITRIVWISQEARLKRRDFSYPMVQQSLRSGLEGYQYYGCSFEGI